MLPQWNANTVWLFPFNLYSRVCYWSNFQHTPTTPTSDNHLPGWHFLQHRLEPSNLYSVAGFRQLPFAWYGWEQTYEEREMKLSSRTLLGSSAESKRGQKSPPERHTSNQCATSFHSRVREGGNLGFLPRLVWRRGQGGAEGQRALTTTENLPLTYRYESTGGLDWGRPSFLIRQITSEPTCTTRWSKFSPVTYQNWWKLSPLTNRLAGKYITKLPTLWKVHSLTSPFSPLSFVCLLHTDNNRDKNTIC